MHFLLKVILFRCALFVLGNLAHQYVGDYDTSSTVVYPPITSPWYTKYFAPFANWDAVYFLRIAEASYEHEQYHAFFPFLPLCIRGVQHIIRLVVPDNRTSFLLAGLLICNGAHLVGTYLIFRLTRVLFASSPLLRSNPRALHRFSSLVATLYGVMPASIFSMAVYTEPLFGALSLAGFLLLAQSGSPLTSRGQALRLGSAACLAAATGCRSNGIVSAGFLLHDTFAYVRLPAPFFSRLSRTLFLLVTMAFHTLVIAAPYVAFQVYGYQRYCTDPTLPVRPWCQARVPHLYPFVQDHYWNVGWFRYYTAKQLPNFLLAAPVFALSVCALVGYLRANPRARLLALGFGHPQSQPEARRPAAGRSEGGRGLLVWATCDRAVVYALHLLFLLVSVLPTLHIQVCLAVVCHIESVIWMHIQARTLNKSRSNKDQITWLQGFVLNGVLTRFLAFSPPLYWCAASLVYRALESSPSPQPSPSHRRPPTTAITPTPPTTPTAGAAPSTPPRPTNCRPGAESEPGSPFEGHTEGARAGTLAPRRPAPVVRPRACWRVPACLVTGYFVGYAAVGTAMFCCFYPWT
ncbi:putative glycosyltransferase family 76 protein [Paratrimastix pyriformis]|uniref:GPI mannosyltransferase 2 n=1 Tax=Paratrimastix pyriformis TaxID=342808 RepID=A0ABQ8UNE2_9EUKA|nr:putative glycosyltransferase family 76 protein [Paratrimastix pyriformis]